MKMLGDYIYETCYKTRSIDSFIRHPDPTTKRMNQEFETFQINFYPLTSVFRGSIHYKGLILTVED